MSQVQIERMDFRVKKASVVRKGQNNSIRFCVKFNRSFEVGAVVSSTAEVRLRIRR